MKALIQRVSRGSVTIDGELRGEIGRGLVVLLGAAEGDRDEDALYLARRVCRSRVFSDSAGKMNLSVMDTGGSLLVISQFTLIANTNKGHRPSFAGAAKPDEANRLYELFIQACREYAQHVATGVFGAMMSVEIINDGPVTVMYESKK